MLNSYPKIYSMGHAAIAELFFDDVVVEEKIDGCVSPNTLILKSNLEYVRAGDLKVGDKLIGVTENLNKATLKEATVTVVEPIKKKCVIVYTDDGRSITASIDHPWCVSSRAGYGKNTHNPKEWIASEDLKIGDEIVALPIWECKDDWKSGYIAGLLDGEGSLVVEKYTHTRTKCLSFYQRLGEVLGKFVEIIKEDGFKYALDIRKRKEHYKYAASVIFRGYWPEILKAIGMYRPLKMKEKAKEVWLNTGIGFLQRVKVVKIIQAGDAEVVGLSTDTKTYNAAGLLCHNSQIQWGIIDGVLQCKSHHQAIDMDCPPKMFAAAVETIKELEPILNHGWIYRAEYLAKPHHNTLTYDRIPRKHLIIFDINIGVENYLGLLDKAEEANRLGLEVVPVFYGGKIDNFGRFEKLLDTDSCLGGQKVEGVVVKNYSRFGRDGKALMGKYVSDKFREMHQKEWKVSTKKDIVTEIGGALKTEARWLKAIQHMKEAGTLQNAPQDIGPLLKEINQDILDECIDEIKEKLFKWAWKDISKMTTRGFPAWYKELLAKSQFS